MRLVVDASVAVKWLTDEDGSELARGLVASGVDLYAPRLMASEVASALWRKAQRGEIEPGQVGALAALAPDMPLHWSEDETLVADAARLALSLGHPVYASLYLALAHRLATTMVTADLRIAEELAATAHGRAVITLAECVRSRLPQEFGR